MDEARNIRIDLLIYFLIYLSLPLPFWWVCSITVFLCFRVWYPDILKEIEREMATQDEPLNSPPLYSEDEDFRVDRPEFFEPSNTFNFEDANDLPPQDEEKDD